MKVFLIVNHGNTLAAIALAALLFGVSACGTEDEATGGEVAGTEAVKQEVSSAALATQSEVPPAEQGSQSELKKKLELEHQELMDMNQRKAELEAEISQIKQAISEADRAIIQKEQELQQISERTSGRADS